VIEPARHVAPAGTPWDAAVAHAAIREIVEDALDRFDPQEFWPAHPLDEGAADGTTGLYFGAAGVLWALDRLRRMGAIEYGHDFRGVLPRLLTANREEYAATAAYPHHASLLFGEVGVLLLLSRLAPDPTIADALFERIADNDRLPVLELMWGTPGTMLACVHMAGSSGEDRWRGAYLVQARRLIAELEETAQGPLWTQALYGERARYLGLVHGYAGNMAALLRGWRWLDVGERARIAAAVPRTLAATAVESPIGANWPAVVGERRPRLVQICHGAPGIVTAFAGAPFSTPEMERLLRAGGELVWRAGPLAKGPNLCHGTAGNGYAFLKLHARTGDAGWLDRARAFAMTAIAQVRSARARYGRGRYALWTGDLGVACYLWDCIEGEGRLPTVDPPSRQVRGSDS
jgi:hypothetical protein